MTELEARQLINMVSSKNFNKDGIAIEWHPLAMSASREFEADVIEIGFPAAYFMYDENVWGQGALYNNTEGYSSLG